MLCVLIQIAKSFWKAWQDFEVRHGNEDTFREMLRIKRSVQAQFSTQVNFVSVQMLAAAAGQETSNKTGNYHILYICTIFQFYESISLFYDLFSRMLGPTLY